MQAISNRRIGFWSLAISLLMLFDFGRSIPPILRDRSILRLPVEAYGRMLTSEPDEKVLVYCAYDTQSGTLGGSYKPKESSAPWLREGDSITVTYSEVEPRKHSLLHEVPLAFRQFLIENCIELAVAVALLVFSFPRRTAGAVDPRG